MRSLMWIAVSTVAWASTQGCATSIAQYYYLTEPEAGPPLCMVYSGVALDIMALRDSSWTNPGPCVPFPLPFILDLPFSLALDSALLPITIPEAIVSALSPAERSDVECFHDQTASCSENWMVPPTP